jgi:hypothetical protein
MKDGTDRLLDAGKTSTGSGTGSGCRPQMAS